MVRRLQQTDREIYLQAAHEFYHSPAVLHPVPDSYLEKTFEECMKDAAYAQGYILEYEGNAAGYALTAKTFSQEAGGYVYWLDELYVKKEYRSKGLGKEFFAYMEEHRDKDVRRFRLEVEADNTRASALYKSLGYENLEYVQMVKEFQEGNQDGRDRTKKD